MLKYLNIAVFILSSILHNFVDGHDDHAQTDQQ